MTHNGGQYAEFQDSGIGVPITPHWITPPTQYEIWLYDGAVKYTFAAVYEDIPPRVWELEGLFGTERNMKAVTDLHAPPIVGTDACPSCLEEEVTGSFQPGAGIPHYGLLAKIEDSQGHSAEIVYEDVKRIPVGSIGSGQTQLGTGLECLDDAPAKGQIKYIKLRSGGRTLWTLLYSYRRFPGTGNLDQMSFEGPNYEALTAWFADQVDVSQDGQSFTLKPTTPPELFESDGTNAIQSIYVFEGENIFEDQSLNQVESTLRRVDLTVHDILNPIPPSSPFEGQDNQDALAAFNLQSANANRRIDTSQIRHTVRYYYSPESWECELKGGGWNLNFPGIVQNKSKGRPALLMTKVMHTPKSPAKLTSSEKLFIYRPIPQTESIIDEPTSLRWLYSIMDESDAELAKAAAGSIRPSDYQLVISPELALKHAPWVLDSDQFALSGSVHFPDSPREFPSWSDVYSKYIREDTTEDLLYCDTDRDTVSHIRIGRPDDARRQEFRVSRLYIVPSEAGGNIVTLPNRSVYSHPYLWHSPGVGEDYIDPKLGESPTLSKARWIAIVDEFPGDKVSAGAAGGTGDAYDEASQEYDTNTTLKPRQVSRRVVSMNPAGFVLRDKSWRFTPSGTEESGSGLGEQYVYKQAKDYFTDISIQAAPEALRDELLMVEHRSVGWSVNDQGPTQGTSLKYTEGLVEFVDYQLKEDLDSSVTPARTTYRVEAADSGIQRGANPVFDSKTGIAVPVKYVSSRAIELPVKPGNGKNTFVTVRLDFTDAVTPAQATTFSQGLPTELSMTLIGRCLPDDGDPQTPTSPAKATFTITERSSEAPANDLTVPANQRRAVSRTVIGAPRRLRPGPDAQWYYPVEKEWYDQSGATTWAASGLVSNPLSPATPLDPLHLDSLIFTYYDRIDAARSGDGPIGSPRNTIIDAKAGESVPQMDSPPSEDDPPLSVTIPAWPEAGWSRLPAFTSEPAALAVTTFRYEGGELSDIYYPNGLRWSRRVTTISPIDQSLLDDGIILNEDQGLIAREYTFNDLQRSSNDEWIATSPCEVKDYNGPDVRRSSVLIKRSVTFDSPFNPDAVYSSAPPAFTRIRAARKAINSDGRIVSADSLEWTGSGWAVAGTKSINDLGEVYRELDLDQNITRVTKNSLGQVMRRYIGTEDTSWVTGRDESPGQSDRFNMVLVERTSYGSSTHDAWQPTVVRRYSTSPPWATPAKIDQRNADYYDDPVHDDDDVEGVPTVTSYDWRMRPVRVDQYDRGIYHGTTTPTRISSTFTYLDHLSRPRLIVSFGQGTIPEAITHLDPSTALADTSPVPSVSSILSASQGGNLKVSSIVEMLYDPDGTVYERRTYDVSSSTPRYQSEFTFNGRGGQQVLRSAAGGPAQVSALDGLGRVKWTASVAPGNVAGASSQADKYAYQLTRTDYVYDKFGNAIETISWDRVRPQGDVLDATNAVRSRTFAWFDLKKRMIATADLGTEQSAGYVSGAAVLDRHSANLSTPPTFASPQEGWKCGATSLEGARVTTTAYDPKSGQTSLQVAPDGVSTSFEYSPAGRLIRKIENSDASSASQRRVTEYEYVLGRVAAVRAYRGDAAQTPPETTRVDYKPLASGSMLNVYAVNGESFTLATGNHAVAWRMRLPQQLGGESVGGASGSGSGGPWISDVTLRYTFSGQVAERIDARGVAFRYVYDALGKLVTVKIGHYESESGNEWSGEFIDGYPASMTPITGSPVDRIQRVEYSYDNLGRLTDIRARDGPLASSSIIAHNQYTYDAFSNLASEVQSHGQPIQQDSPAISYAWDYAPSDPDHPEQPGHNRITRITYPLQPSDLLGQRVLEIQYRSTIEPVAPEVDDVISRQTAITQRFSSWSNATASTPLAQFAYTGAGHRKSTMRGRAGTAPEIAQDFSAASTGPIGLSGLDRFGRVQNLAYSSSAVTNSLLFRGEYSYDDSGNRAKAIVTQVPVSSGPPSGIRSQDNTYDAFDRLTTSSVVEGVSGPGTTNALIQKDFWRLDLLGNWDGSGPLAEPSAPTGVGRFTDVGSGTDRSYTQVPNQRNEIDRANFTGYAGYPAPSVGSDNGITVYDAAGNIIFDGVYSYQYDAWNRLIQINKASFTQTNGVPRSPPDGLGGTANDPPPIDIGVLVKHFTYDGLGRLIRTQSPLPEPGASMRTLRSEHFYYDGVRRIQEVVVDPIRDRTIDPEEEPLPAGAPPEAEPGTIGDPETLPITEEPGQIEGEPGNPNFIPTVALAREYVHGPGDSFAGVDETIALFDGTFGGVSRAKPWWTLQDAGGDVVALCETPRNQASAVARQFVYDPYGAVIAADTLRSSPNLSLGHKGLFFDRLDVGVVDPASWAAGGAADTSRLVPQAHAVYHVRNRTYQPTLGRWMQRDPNATAMTLIEAVSHSGGAIGALAGLIDVESMYGDGMNLYEYLGSNPGTRWDPIGLSILSELWEAEVRGLEFLAGAIDPVGMIGEVYEAVLTQYFNNQSADADWAMNWNLGDDNHSRNDDTWIYTSGLIGAAKHFGVGFDTFNPVSGTSSAQVLAGNSLPRQLEEQISRGAGVLRVLKNPQLLDALKAQVRDVASRMAKGGKLTQAGLAYTKHPKIAGHATMRGNDAFKNDTGMAVVNKYLTSGVPVHVTGREVYFLDANLSGRAIKIKVEPSDFSVRQVDFLDPQ
jgi:hypothetical protein